MFYFDNEQHPEWGAHRNHAAQASMVGNIRSTVNRHNAQMMGNDAAVLPRDVAQEFDRQQVELMRANNLTLLSDLMPLARSLAVGKIESIHRRVSDSGTAKRSLTGRTTVDIDKAGYDYDSTIKVVHQDGFGRDWMEMQGQRTEAFDGLVDDQANSNRTVLDSIATHIYSGALDENGNVISYNGTAATGIKTSTKTVAVDLDASGLNIDFTSGAATPDDIRAGWVQLVKTLRVDNNVGQDITFYISADIETNFQRFYGTTAGDTGKTIMTVLKELAGVADIKVDRSLSGNEVVGLVLNAQFIRPLIGMAVSTVPLFRANPMDAYNYMTWANVGLEIRTDFTGKSGVMYARNIA
ncbi:MAG: major capsid protein [Sulfitobacter sp.]|uniref:major capsid protein n=1 Tax=Alphaproteobacteria TaxID=28211 RepID=UPI0029426440|nr:major capsid protein [Sulfitobacter sp. LC.270.F.C4]WOI13511.1 DUF6260 family protein [Sulfitobacter sp. LC.270.F.C4]